MHSYALKRHPSSMRSLLHSAFALLCMLAPLSFAQSDFDDVEITATHVNGSVYMLTGQGGNIAISVGDDGVLMVDDQFLPLADKIEDAIAELGGSAPTFLLNTHWHGDHTGGNEAFSDHATIIAHDNVRSRLADPSANRVAEALPTITFDHNLSLHFNDEEIQALHHGAAHTDGDAVIHFIGSNVIHFGDQFFNMRYPFVDLSSGGSVEGLLTNLQTLLSDLPDDVKIIPGHGALTDTQGFEYWVNEVTMSVQIVIDKINAGATLESILEEGMPERYQEWGTGFISEEAWISTIFQDLAE